MEARSRTNRRMADVALKGVSTLAALVGIFSLVWIIYEVALRGAGAINWEFFTRATAPPGMEGGGVGNAIVGTFLMTLLAVVIGVPVGLSAGIYLSEYGADSRLAGAVRFSGNVMMGIPSIIVGLFVYTLMVLPMRNFSGYAGAVSLAIIMLPIVARTSEDMLSMVPNTLRESAMALGAPRWKVTLGVVFRGARNGLITGVILAVARVSGETAPLLFTALNGSYWPKNLNGPTANLTVTIFNYAMSPYPDWQQIAWGASLIIMAAVLAMTLVTRFIFKEKSR